MLANLVGELAKKRITQQDLSELLGIHRNSVANKLFGDTSMTVKEAFAIYDAYFAGSGIDFRWLFEQAAKESA